MANKLMIDLDDTAYSFNDLAKQVRCELGICQDKNAVVLSGHSETCPNRHDAIEYTTKDTWACFLKFCGNEAGAKQLLAACFTADKILANTPYDNAAEVIAKLSDQFDIYYVSDRPTDTFEPTKQWLKMHNFPTPENLVVTHDKRDWIADHSNDLVTIIDDRPRTLAHVRFDLDIDPVYGLKQDWNTDLTDIPGIMLYNNWLEIGEAFAVRQALATV